MIRLIIEIITRALAVILLVSGFIAALFVLEKATNLYEDPNSIEPFAERVETATGLDRKLTSVLAGAIGGDAEGGEGNEGAANGADGSTPGEPDPASASGNETPQSKEMVRLSYFVAWIIVILLLSLLIRISLAMVHTGGILVLHDLRAHPKPPPEQAKPPKRQ